MPRERLVDELVVDNLAQLVKTFNHAPADVKKAFKAELRTVALPIQQDAERLNTARIPRMRLSPKWAKTRIGVTQKSVYVAPVQRGVKARARTSLRRHNLKVLMLERSFDPALTKNAPKVEADFARMLDRLVVKWGSEGP